MFKSSWCKVGMLSLALAVAAGCHDMKAADENATKVDKNAPTVPGDVNNKTPLPAMRKMAIATVTPSGAATTMPTNNHVTGKVTFTDIGGKVLIVADITSLEPNTKHGFHIHQKADLTDPKLMSAGDHFDPDQTHKHGDPMKMGMMNMIHAGDMGNLVADDKGDAHLELTVTDLTIDGEKNGVIGHSVIIHAKADDFVTQPTGNSGGRIAGGVIEAMTMK